MKCWQYLAKHAEERTEKKKLDSTLCFFHSSPSPSLLLSLLYLLASHTRLPSALSVCGELLLGTQTQGCEYVRLQSFSVRSVSW